MKTIIILYIMAATPQGTWERQVVEGPFKDLQDCAKVGYFMAKTANYKNWICMEHEVRDI